MPVLSCAVCVCAAGCLVFNMYRRQRDSRPNDGRYGSSAAVQTPTSASAVASSGEQQSNVPSITDAVTIKID